MRMSPQGHARGTRPSPIAFEGLPCGCVAGVYLTGPRVLEVELVEVKGPHCRYFQHQAGRVVHLGAADETEEN